VEADKNSIKPKQKNLLQLSIGLLMIVIGVLAVFRGINSITDEYVSLVAPNGIISVEVRDTFDGRQKGLSGRASIDADKGMLFVFDESELSNCFWMKDMRFDIDMVWLDENRNVVTVEKSVTPESYPESFCPDKPAKYGLELKSGRAKELGISESKIINFDI
jgi:uncharacterized membrane protein (UPF0127 family)